MHYVAFSFAFWEPSKEESNLKMTKKNNDMKLQTFSGTPSMPNFQVFIYYKENQEGTKSYKVLIKH